MVIKWSFFFTVIICAFHCIYGQIFEALFMCPENYRQLPDVEVCIKYENGLRTTWKEAQEFCDNRYLVSYETFEELSAAISSEEVQPGSYAWTSMTLDNGRFVWNNGIKTAVFTNQPTIDNIYNSTNQQVSFAPLELEGPPVQTLSSVCGAVFLNPRGIQGTQSLQMDGCSIARHQAVCVQQQVALYTYTTTNSENDRAYTGCDKAKDYTNAANKRCLTVVKSCLPDKLCAPTDRAPFDFCTSVTCSVCPQGHSLVSITDEWQYQNFIHAKKKLKPMQKAYLGLYIRPLEITQENFRVYNMNGQLFEMSSFPFRHPLRQFLDSYQGSFFERPDRPTEDVLCLIQDSSQFDFALCNDDTINSICHRPKSAVTSVILVADEPISEDIYVQYKTADLKQKLLSFKCQDTNSIDDPVLLRDGILVTPREIREPEEFALTGCYSCMGFGVSGVVHSNKICVDIADNLKFIVQFSADYSRNPFNPFNNIENSFNYNREKLTDHDSEKAEAQLMSVISQEIVQHLDIFEVYYLARVNILPSDIIDGPNKNFRLTFHFIVKSDSKTIDNFIKYTNDIYEYLEVFETVLNKLKPPGGLAKRAVDLTLTDGVLNELVDIDPRYTPAISDLAIYNTEYCLGFTTENGINVGTLAAGQIVDRNCSDESNITISARCEGSRILGYTMKEVIAEACRFKQILRQLSDTVVNSSNANEILNQVATLFRENVDPGHYELAYDIIISVTNILTKVSSVGNFTYYAGRDLCYLYNTLLESDGRQVERASNKLNVTNDLVVVMDNFTRTFNLENQTAVHYTYSNLQVSILDVTADNVNSGTIGIVSLRNSSLLTAPRLLKGSPTNTSNIDLAIYISENALKYILKKTGRFRLSFLVQHKTAVFPNETSPKPITDEPAKTLNTGVISMSLPLIVNEYLNENKDEKVTIIFQQKDSDISSASTQCVFWNTEINDWSGEGCTYIKSNDGVVQCECNHLTNFAALMGGYFTIEEKKALEVVTIVGLALSIFGLTLTVLTFLLFAKVRKGQPQRVLFCLALTLIAAYIVFLAGINQTGTVAGCVFVGAFLHYLILAAFMWMLTEALLQYLYLIKVFGVHIDKFIFKACLVCFSVPLIPVIIVLAVDYNTYRYRVSEGLCWLEPWMSYWTFLIPMGLILITNFGVFVAVLRRITTQPATLKQTNTSKSDKKIAVYAGIGCTLLLGLTWIFGYFTLFVGDNDSARTTKLVFAYLFTILNTLHGLFIFLFFTLRDHKVRQYWRQLLCKKDRRERYTAPSTDTNKSKPTESTDSKENLHSVDMKHKDLSRADSDSSANTLKNGEYDLKKAYELQDLNHHSNGNSEIPMP